MICCIHQGLVVGHQQDIHPQLFTDQGKESPDVMHVVPVKSREGFIHQQHWSESPFQQDEDPKQDRLNRGYSSTEGIVAPALNGDTPMNLIRNQVYCNLASLQLNLGQHRQILIREYGLESLSE